MKRSTAIYILLTTAILAVFWPALGHGFIHLDDAKYITQNGHVSSGITLDNLLWALTATRASNWHPLTWISHMLDCELYGLNAAGHHLTSLLLHIANTILLMLFLSRVTGSVWKSAFVAAMFAIHPLHVESVVWAAERKDVLSALFWMLAMLAYAGYVANPTPRRYAIVFAALALGLMAKSMLVTLPLVLLLLDYWPLGRFKTGESFARRLRHLIMEKTPLLALSAASCVITYLVQQQGGATATLAGVPLSLRIENTLVVYVAYIKMMIWPFGLAVFYPHPGAGIPTWQVAASGIALAGITAFAVRGARRRPYLLVGWLWYLITLLPVIGIVQVGQQAMADRYTYLPLVGLFIVLAWLVPGRIRRLGGSLALPAVVIVMMLLAGRQVGYWRDEVTLFRHAIDVTAPNAFARNCLGMALERRGEVANATREFSEAVRIDPELARAHSNLARCLAEQGDMHGAIREYRRTLQLTPDNPLAANDLAWIYATHSDARLHNVQEGVRLAKFACGTTHNRNAWMLDTLAAAYASAGRFDDAVRTAEKALRIAESSGQAQVARQIRERLRLYETHRAYRE